MDIPCFVSSSTPAKQEIKICFNSFTPKSAKFKTEETILNFILQNCQKQTIPHDSTAQ